jgi:hypothetical protein
MAPRRVPKRAVWRRHRVWPWALAAGVLLLLVGLQLARNSAPGGTPPWVAAKTSPDTLRGRPTASSRPGPSLPRVAVLDVHGAPVPGCVVELRVPGDREAVAGTAAEVCDAVELSDVPAGDYLLRAEAPGYQRAERPVHLAPGRSPLSLRLLDGLALSGRVVDGSGRPLAGVSVEVFPTEATARTNALGAFRVGVPSAGVYSLEAHHSDWGGAVQAVTAPAAPVLLRLEPHSVLEVQVHSGGQPVEGAQALLQGQDAAAARQYAADRTTDADGGVRLLGIPAGHYMLDVGRPGALSPYRQEVVLREGVTTAVRVALPPLPAVAVATPPKVYRGRVVDETQTPVPFFRIGDVTVEAEDGRFALPLPARGGTVAFTVEAPPLAMAAVAWPADVEKLGDVVLHRAPLVQGLVQEADGGPAGGAFVLCEGCRSEASGERHLAAFADGDGRFQLAITGPSGVLVRLLAMKDERLGFAEAGRKGEAARLTLAPPSAVRGQVRHPDGTPAPGVAVVFSESLLEPLLLVTGPDGRFAGEVPPGLYQVTLQPEASRPRRTWTVQVPVERALELVSGAAGP